MVSNIFYFHPYLGKIPILTSIFFKWVVQPPTSSNLARKLDDFIWGCACFVMSLNQQPGFQDDDFIVPNLRVEQQEGGHSNTGPI